MAIGGHGLPKVSPGPASPDPSTPCGRATPLIGLRLFQGCPTRRAGGLLPSSTLMNTQRHTPVFLLYKLTSFPSLSGGGVGSGEQRQQSAAAGLQVLQLQEVEGLERLLENHAHDVDRKPTNQIRIYIQDGI
jgi:hypothetical protein